MLQSYLILNINFFRDRREDREPRLISSCFGLSIMNVQSLHTPTKCISLHFSSQPWPKLYNLYAFCLAVCFTPQRLFPLWLSSICCRRGGLRWGRCCPRWGWFLWRWARTSTHPIIEGQWSLVRHRRRNREDQIAHGNGRNPINGRVSITPMLKLCLYCADLAWLEQESWHHLASPASLRLQHLRGLDVPTQLVHSQGHHHQHHAPVSPSWGLRLSLWFVVKPK